MAKVIAFGQPVNDVERDAIAYLRGHLPNTYEILHNLEIKQNKEVFEIDLVILAPQCVFVVDIKGIHGRIEVFGSKWHPEGRQPYYSPVAKLRQHAKVLSSLISDANRINADLRRVHVQAAVLMTADDVHLVDSDGRDKDYVTYCNHKCLAYFQRSDFIPERRLQNIRPFLPTIKRTIQGKASAKSAPPRYRDWQVEEKLGGNDRYTDYRARKTFIDSGTVRLRVYKVDPYQGIAEREAERKLIGNAFRALLKVPPHVNILGVRDFFETDDGDSLVLVTDDISGQALRQNIKKQDLSLEQTLGIMREVLIALDHAHKHGIIHRNLTPDNILLGSEGQVRLVGFDYARITHRTSTIGHNIIDNLEDDAAYQATECYRDPSKASVTSDLFSTGLVFYELLTGQQAFESAEQICDRGAVFPTKPSELQPDLSPGLDNWLQKLCSFEPQNRFPDADTALRELTALATLQTLDLTNLPIDSPIDDRYRVLERLGHPGSFAVAYKVLDTLGDEVLVLKLVTRDRRSVYERLRQEYKTLKQIPEHPYVVKVIWAGELKDGTPFITFEYVEGQDVEHLIEAKQLSLQQAVQIAQQTANGLAHLHQHGVYHQDIKPSNLFLTEGGVRIIDFNIAISNRDEEVVSAGTRRYLPPDFKPTREPSTTDKIDRDLYALGITFYECVTGCYPFDEPNPPLGKPPKNPKEVQGCEALSEELVALMTRAIAHHRTERFASAEEFLKAVTSLTTLLKPEEQIAQTNEQPQSLAVNNSDSETEQQLQEAPEALSSVATIETQAQADASDSTRLGVTTSDTNAKSQTSSRLSPLSSDKKSTFNLFDPPPPIPANENHIISEKSSDKLVVLDPTGLYEISPGYTAITTEVQWIRCFFVTEGRYWVTGKGLQAKRLCNWTHEWLRVWNKTEAIAEIKQDPRSKLLTLFHPVSLPDEWTDQQLLALATRLDSYPQDNPIAYLLADITGSDQQIWIGEPSIQNLAAWLAIQMPQEYIAIERVWQQQFKEHDLATYYQAEDKTLLLRRWLGITKPVITELGKYPLSVPNFLTEEFSRYWEEQLYRTDGKALDTLMPTQVAGMELIAACAYNVLSNRPNWIKKARETKVAAYLSHEQRVKLSDLQPPPEPQPLALDASPKQALTWATESYLPFRRWEMVNHQPPSERRISDRLADSFLEWILEHYPEMKVDSVDNSYLNYSAASLVRNLCRETPVLWVVVDGLGWLDHIELLSFLTKNHQLTVETYIEPRFSVLPTKTEYAKWSLYAQLLPCDSSWVADAGKAFPKMGMGERYTDYRRAELCRDLREGKHQLYCWDTEQFDELHHTERDWQHLYRVKRPHALEGIAKEIQSFVEEYSNSDRIRVVIASDHGQIFGISEQITHYDAKLEPQGRMAIGKTDNPQFVVLERDRYGLPHDISVVRSAASLGSFSYTTNKQILGSHGGLFPEEVVVGVSVLRKSVQRRPVLIFCRGEGKPRQTGELEITIDNPNLVPLTDLSLYIKELPSFESGKPLEEKIPANQRLTFKVTIPEVPELPPNHEGNCLSLSGEITFRFASTEPGSANLASDSTIIINQIFSSGFDIDEFL